MGVSEDGIDIYIYPQMASLIGKMMMNSGILGCHPLVCVFFSRQPLRRMIERIVRQTLGSALARCLSARFSKKQTKTNVCSQGLHKMIIKVRTSGNLLHYQQSIGKSNIGTNILKDDERCVFLTIGTFKTQGPRLRQTKSWWQFWVHNVYQPCNRCFSRRSRHTELVLQKKPLENPCMILLHLIILVAIMIFRMKTRSQK